jgi:hypothetical protein
MEILNENDIGYNYNYNDDFENKSNLNIVREESSQVNEVSNKILEEDIVREKFNIIENIIEEDEIEISIDPIVKDNIILNNNEIENKLSEIVIDENKIQDINIIEKQDDKIPDFNVKNRNKVDFNHGLSLLSSLPSENNDISKQLLEFDKWKKSCNNEELKEFMELIEYKQPIESELDDSNKDNEFQLNLAVDTSMNSLITNHLLNIYNFYDKQLKSGLEMSLIKAWSLLKDYTPNMKEQGSIPASIKPLLNANEVY